MSFFRNRRVALHALAAAVLGTASLCHAQSSRPPLRVIIPADAGSGLDVIARSLQPQLSKSLGGQAVVVENSPAAGGVVATSQLVKAAPDGNTISLVSNNHVVNPSIYAKLPYDALKDITAVSTLGSIPLVLVADPKLNVGTARELVAHIRSRPPGSQNFASSGNGTIIHLAAKMFADAADLNMVHVPYKGVSPQVMGLITGEAAFGVVALPAALGYLNAGQLRAIAILGRERVGGLPNVRTLAEEGFDFDLSAWFTVIAPARLSAAEISRLHEAFGQALKDPQVRETLARQQIVINPSSPEAAAAFLGKEHERYAAVAKAAGVKVD